MINLKIIIVLFLSLSCAARTLSHEAQQFKYAREDWRHWSDKDKNCLNTRAEILKSRSLIPVKMNRKGCTVKFGEWQDYYYPETHTDAARIDIDHLIPLKYAHDNGGANWSNKEKEKFANDPENLVITNRSYNRQKGAKGIDQWLPVHKPYACKYIRDWVKIKNKYHLKINDSELDSVEGC